MLKTLLVGGAAALVFMTSHAVADGMPRGAPVASVVCDAQLDWPLHRRGHRGCLRHARSVGQGHR